MATFTEKGHTALALALYQLPFFFVLGTLPEDYPDKWTVDQEPPPFDLEDSIIQPVGYKIETYKTFVQEASDGLIEAFGKRYTPFPTPTRFLYVEFKLDKEDAVGQTFYQLGLAINTKIKPDVPQGKQFFLPEEIEDPGILLLGENIRPTYKNIGEVRQYYTLLQF